MSHNLHVDAGHDLMEELSKDLAKQIQEEIDFQIIGDMLVTMGWTRITFNPHQDEKTCADIKFWIDNYCRGNCKSLNDVWLFENEKDAMWFTLRWGELSNGR